MDLDGKRYHQSMALLRYAGKRAGLYSEDPLVALTTDQVLDTLQDLVNTIATSIVEKDAETKLAMRKKLEAETIPKAYGVLENILGDNQFLTGESLSVADLFLLVSCRNIRSGNLDHVSPSALDGAPKVLALVDRLEEDPKIKEFTDMHKK